MVKVIPAVIAKDFNELKNKLAIFSNNTNIIQIDVCDGKFVPSVSWPMQTKDESSVRNIINEEEGLPFWDKLDFEFDLMVLNAVEQFDFFVHLGAKKIIFHIEAENEIKLKEFLEGIDMYTRDNIEIGIALNITTPISSLKSIISYVDFVQCMGIEHIGFQGEPFDEKVIDKIKELKSIYPDIKISIDGGVNEKTAPLLVKAGADILVAGSIFLNSYDIKETIDQLENLTA